MPPEVRHNINNLLGLGENESLTSTNVIRYAQSQTCERIEALGLFGHMTDYNIIGVHNIWERLVHEEEMSPESACHVQEIEARTLLQLYAPWEERPSVFNKEDMDWNDQKTTKSLANS
jgi:hypothetical protein